MTSQNKPDIIQPYTKRSRGWTRIPLSADFKSWWILEFNANCNERDTGNQQNFRQEIPVCHSFLVERNCRYNFPQYTFISSVTNVRGKTGIGKRNLRGTTEVIERNECKKNYNFEREINSNGTPLQLIASDKNQPPKKKQLQNNKPHLQVL